MVDSIRCKELREDRAKFKNQNRTLLDVVEKRDAEAVAGGNDASGLTAEEATTFDERQARIEAMTDEVKRRELVLQQEAEWSKPLDRVSQPAPLGREPEVATEEPRKIVVPASAKRWAGQLRNFHGPDAEMRAYRFGTACLGAMGFPAALKRCEAMGIPLSAATPHKEGDMSTGGVFVVEEIDPDFIRLVEEYGVIRRTARMRRMTSDTSKRRRRTGGNTAYFVSEGGTGTHTKATFDWINLVAKDVQVITTLTEDLNEDAVLSLADVLVEEIAYAIVKLEDDCAFNGDATSTYGGITGVLAKLKGLSGTIANIAGLTVGAGNLYSELTLANFESVVGNLPTFGDTGRARWFCHKVFWHTVMVKILHAAGGITARELEEARRPLFLGYPVELVQIMPKTEGNSQVCALLGDMFLAADFGDRRQTTIKFSTDASVDSVSMFETSQIAIKGTSRFDFVAHDVGNASGTASLREPGPIVGLITAAS